MKWVVVLLAALTLPSAAQPSTEDDLLGKLCPARTPYTLDAAETAILNAVAAHYRRIEWSSEQARKEGTFIAASGARHAVPSLASPQVLLLDAIVLPLGIEAALQIELQRHGVAPDLAATLRQSLGARNQTALALQPPKTALLPLSCRELWGMAFGGAAPPKGDFKNISKAIAIALPAFDASRKTALLLSINDLEYVFEGKTEDLELTLLRAGADGTWQIDWHTDLEGLRGPRDATPPASGARATAEDYAVFDAVLSHLGQSRFQGAPCIAVVNQTRHAQEYLPGARPELEKLLTSPAAIDLRNRGAASAYLGAYAPKRAIKLVQREALFGRAEDFQGCTGAIRFSLPGYAATAAVIDYTVITVTSEVVEQGESLALLTKTESGWRVASDTYHWQMRSPRR